MRGLPRPAGRRQPRAQAPAIAGQRAAYVQRQLQNFRAGVRGADQSDAQGAQMRSIALTLPNDATDVRAPYAPDPSTFLDPLKLHDKVLNDVVGNEESRRLDDLTLFIDHSFGGADFRSTTNWRTFDTVNREDEDGTNRIALYFDTANIEHNSAWYQEFKFSGQSGVFDWVGGLSYYSEDARQASDTHA